MRRDRKRPQTKRRRRQTYNGLVQAIGADRIIDVFPAPPHGMAEVGTTYLIQRLRSVSGQCGNVIYNGSQGVSFSHEKHMQSWRGLKRFVDETIKRFDPTFDPNEEIMVTFGGNEIVKENSPR